MKNMNREEFIIACKDKKIELDDHQLWQFETYMHLLQEWNQKMNLTAITEEDQVWEKHFYDSLLPFSEMEFTSLCDVGSGAGFPGIPVKIVHPDVEMTLLEPIQKRCRFLNTVIETLELKNVHVLSERAEDHAKKNREKYDVVTARAVANLPVLMELCVPLMKVGGTFIALKGKNGHEEVLEAQMAADLLGVKMIREEVFESENASRVNIYYEKVKSTPNKYPRNFGMIKKKPLGGK